MKQFKFITVLAVVALVSFSCEKNHICECVTFKDLEEQPKIENTYPLENLSRNAAIDACNDWDSTEVSLSFVRTTTNCELQ